MSPQRISDSIVTARKAHLCQTCNTTAIQPGTKYRRDVLVYDGRIYTWIQCNGCRECAGYVWDYSGSPDEGIGQDSYADWADEMSIHGEGDEQQAARDHLIRIGRASSITERN